MAAGITGGIIATALLGPLQAAQEEAKKFGEALGKAGERWNKLISKRGRDVEFERKTSRMDLNSNPDDIRKQKETEEDAAAAKQAELEEARAKMAALTAAAKPEKPPTHPAEKSTSERLLNLASGGLSGLVSDSMEKATTDTAAKASEAAAVEALRKTKQQIEDLESEIEEHKGHAETLGGKLEDAETGKRQREEAEKQTKEKEEQLKLAEKIGKEVETPYEKAQAKQEELNNAMLRGVIDADTYDRASKKNQKELTEGLAAEQGPERHNRGVAGRGAQAYESVREAVKQFQGHQNRPEVNLLKQIAANTAAEVKASKQRGAPDDRPLTIPP
jgi:chromosome segregation ATPase